MSVVKKIVFASGLLLPVIAGSAQTPAALDSIQLKPLKGPLISYGGLTRQRSVVLVCFWSSNSESTLNEVNAINKQYDKWKQLTSFKMIAVCVDQGNLLSRMRPTANMNDWHGFDVCADINGDLQLTLKAGNLPQSVILKDGAVVYQQSGFEAGTEEYLFSKIKALSDGR